MRNMYVFRGRTRVAVGWGKDEGEAVGEVADAMPEADFNAEDFHCVARRFPSDQEPVVVEPETH